MIRALVIDDVARAKVQRVIEHAKEHPYRPTMREADAPGNDPRFVAELGSYRVVFTFTHHGGKVYRHLSISVPRTPGRDNYPNPIAIFEIATLFGFTGYDRNQPDKPGPWNMDLNEHDRCVMVVQELS